MKKIWIKKLGGTFFHNGQKYGPSEKPVEVPEDLAAALGIPEFDGEVPKEEDEVAEVDQLKNDLEAAQAALREIMASHQEEQEKFTAVKAEFETLVKEKDAELDKQLRIINDLKDDNKKADKQVKELSKNLESANKKIDELSKPAEAEEKPATKGKK